MNLPELSAPPGTLPTAAPFVALYIIPLVIAAELALYGWHWRQIRTARLFVLLMTAVVFWSLCHALSVASSTLAATRFWAQVQYGGIVLVAPLWLLFALAYYNSSKPIRPAYRAVLLLPAAASYAAVLTNEWHHLWWKTVALDMTRPFGSLSVTRGPLFWLHIFYSYGCVLLGFGLIVRRMLAASPLQQRQARLVAAGALIPIVGNAAHLLGLRTTLVDDPTPFLFAFSGLVIVYAALRYQFPDLLPVSQQALFASLPDGLVVLDQGGIVTAVNDRASRLLERAAEGRAWIGQMFQRLIAGSPLEAELRALLTSPAAPATQHVYPGEQSARGVELRLEPLFADDVRAGSLLLVRDGAGNIEGEQAADRRIEESQRTVLAAITHELRTPLTSIMGFTDMLDRGIYGKLPERVHEPLGHMRRNSQTLLRLVNDILNFSKLEAEQPALDLAPIDLSAVIEDVVGVMQPPIQERGLALVVDLAVGAPPVLAVRERLEQVLTNLLANAIKFTDEGTITVRTAHAGDRVQFSVKDTGIGIAPEDQPVIFEPFQQIENEHQGRSRGTGLGLAISRRLMESMGGTLVVKSTPGSGSTFVGELQVAENILLERERGMHQ